MKSLKLPADDGGVPGGMGLIAPASVRGLSFLDVIDAGLGGVANRSIFAHPRRFAERHRGNCLGVHVRYRIPLSVSWPLIPVDILHEPIQSTLHGLLVAAGLVRLTGPQEGEHGQPSGGGVILGVAPIENPVPVGLLHLRQPGEPEHDGFFALFAAAELLEQALFGRTAAVLISRRALPGRNARQDARRYHSCNQSDFHSCLR